MKAEIIKLAFSILVLIIILVLDSWFSFGFSTGEKVILTMMTYLYLTVCELKK